ncbi:MAG: hypothetical protein O7C98_01155 [Planctomycetota bacterium]|nr:hypothetical protein [Planctomycetota bacterium]
MRRITCLLVIVLLCGGLSSLQAEETAGDEAQAKIKALERELAVLKRALAYFQGRSKPRTRASSRDLLSDLKNLRQLVVLVRLSREGPPAADGRLDIYRFVRSEEIADEHFDVFTSHRCGIRPTNAEIKAGDYTHFPFGRYKGARVLGTLPATPWLWERYPHPDGQRVVGYSNGTAKRIPEAEFQALMKKHGQDP